MKKCKLILRIVDGQVYKVVDNSRMPYRNIGDIIKVIDTVSDEYGDPVGLVEDLSFVHLCQVESGELKFVKMCWEDL